MNNYFHHIMGNIPANLTQYILPRSSKPSPLDVLPHFVLDNSSQDPLSVHLRGVSRRDKQGSSILEAHSENLAAAITYLTQFPTKIIYERGIGGVMMRRSVLTPNTDESFCNFLVETTRWDASKKGRVPMYYSYTHAQKPQIALDLLCYQKDFEDAMQVREDLLKSKAS